MANPAKRTSSGEAPSAPEPKPVPPKAKAKAAAAQRSAPTRYTPPAPTGAHGPSPRWVAVAMFALWIVGLLVIVLNYMSVLPGTGDESNGWYLVAGLVSILAGIMVATRYR